jgi:hypothetical protein
MATGGGNLYPNWLGSASLTIPTNSVQTTVTVQGIPSYATTVNVVPQVLLSSISTATLNTADPSEVFSFVVPATGWYKSDWNCTASHVSASNWNSMSQLFWAVYKNGSLLSNTRTLIEPQYNSGASVSEFISMPGVGVFQANAGDILDWVTDADSVSGSPITAGFFSGFGFISLQKIA